MGVGGCCGTNILPQIFQHNIVHTGKVGVNKAAAVVKNSHVQQQEVPELRLKISLLCNSHGYHVEEEINVADSTLRCCSGYLKKWLWPTNLLGEIYKI